MSELKIEAVEEKIPRPQKFPFFLRHLLMDKCLGSRAYWRKEFAKSFRKIKMGEFKLYDPRIREHLRDLREGRNDRSHWGHAPDLEGLFAEFERIMSCRGCGCNK